MTASRGQDDAGTASKILDVAERLVQVRGFNGFSYADIAAELHITKARKMCLCGMLAAEYQTLPPPMQDAVIGFFDRNETWLEGVLEQGRQDGSLQFAGSARDTARMIVGGLEGAMLVARPYGDIARFQAAAAHLLAGLAPAAGGPGPGPLGLPGQPNTTVRAPASTTRSSA